MNYRDLLKKYLNYVGEYEGTTFLGGWQRIDMFTDEEWAELNALEAESFAEWREAHR